MKTLLIGVVFLGISCALPVMAAGEEKSLPLSTTPLLIDASDPFVVTTKNPEIPLITSSEEYLGGLDATAPGNKDAFRLQRHVQKNPKIPESLSLSLNTEQVSADLEVRIDFIMKNPACYSAGIYWDGTLMATKCLHDTRLKAYRESKHYIKTVLIPFSAIKTKKIHTMTIQPVLSNDHVLEIAAIEIRPAPHPEPGTLRKEAVFNPLGDEDDDDLSNPSAGGIAVSPSHVWAETGTEEAIRYRRFGRAAASTNGTIVCFALNPARDGSPGDGLVLAIQYKDEFDQEQVEKKEIANAFFRIGSHTVQLHNSGEWKTETIALTPVVDVKADGDQYRIPIGVMGKNGVKVRSLGITRREGGKE